MIAIGQGIPDMAADFRDKRGIQFPLLIDHDRTSYKALKLKRGTLTHAMGPAVIARGALKVLKGNIQALPPKDSDLFQMGAVAIVDKGGDILYIHRNKDAADDIPIEEIIKRLP